MNRAFVLAFSDFRNIRRDGLLLMATLAPVLLALVVKFGLPWVGLLLNSYFGFNLTPHNPLIISFYLLLSPLILGMLAGFLLLDDRDEGTLEYLSITPLTRQGYLFYRIAGPVIVSFLLTLVGLGFILGSTQALKMVPVVLMGSLESPLIALFLASFAANKVEGLALSKVSGIFLLAPIVEYLVQTPWQLVAGVMPTFWVSKGFLAGLSGSSSVPWLLVGFLVHWLYIYFLYQKFIGKVS